MHDEKLLVELLKLYGKIPEGSGLAVLIVTTIKHWPEPLTEVVEEYLPNLRLEAEVSELADASEAKRAEFVEEFWRRANLGEAEQLAYPGVFAELQELNLSTLEISEVIRTAGPDGAIEALRWLRGTLRTLSERGGEPQAAADTLLLLLSFLGHVGPGETDRTTRVLSTLSLQVPKKCEVLPTVVLYAAYEILKAAKQQLTRELE